MVTNRSPVGVRGRGQGAWSLQAEALRVGDGDDELVLELLPGAVRRQADLVETGVGDGQPVGGTKDISHAHKHSAKVKISGTTAS